MVYVWGEEAIGIPWGAARAYRRKHRALRNVLSKIVALPTALTPSCPRREVVLEFQPPARGEEI